MRFEIIFFIVIFCNEMKFQKIIIVTLFLSMEVVVMLQSLHNDKLINIIYSVIRRELQIIQIFLDTPRTCINIKELEIQSICFI